MSLESMSALQPDRRVFAPAPVVAPPSAWTVALAFLATVGLGRLTYLAAQQTSIALGALSLTGTALLSLQVALSLATAFMLAKAIQLAYQRLTYRPPAPAPLLDAEDPAVHDGEEMQRPPSPAPGAEDGAIRDAEELLPFRLHPGSASGHPGSDRPKEFISTESLPAAESGSSSSAQVSGLSSDASPTLVDLSIQQPLKEETSASPVAVNQEGASTTQPLEVPRARPSTVRCSSMGCAHVPRLATRMQTAECRGANAFSLQSLLDCSPASQIDQHFLWLEIAERHIRTQPAAGEHGEILREVQTLRAKFTKILNDTSLSLQKRCEAIHNAVNDSLIGHKTVSNSSPAWRSFYEYLSISWLTKPLQAYTAPLMVSLWNRHRSAQTGACSHHSLTALMSELSAAIRSTQTFIGPYVNGVWDVARATAIHFRSIYETNPSTEFLTITSMESAKNGRRTLHQTKVLRSPLLCQQTSSNALVQGGRGLLATVAAVCRIPGLAPKTMALIPEAECALQSGRSIMYLSFLNETPKKKGEAVEPGALHALRQAAWNHPTFELLEINLNKLVEEAPQHRDELFQYLASELRSDPLVADTAHPKPLDHLISTDPKLAAQWDKFHSLATEVANQLQSPDEEKAASQKAAAYLLIMVALLRVQLIADFHPDLFAAICKDGMDRAGAMNMVFGLVALWLAGGSPDTIRAASETLLMQCLAACFLAKGKSINKTWGGYLRSLLEVLEGNPKPFKDRLHDLFPQDLSVGPVLDVALPNEGCVVDPASPSMAYYLASGSEPKRVAAYVASMKSGAEGRAPWETPAHIRHAVVMARSSPGTPMSSQVTEAILTHIRAEFLPAAACSATGLSTIAQGALTLRSSPASAGTSSNATSDDQTGEGGWQMSIDVRLPSGAIEKFYLGGSWSCGSPDDLGRRVLSYSVHRLQRRGTASPPKVSVSGKPNAST
ncbi:MAG: hypothetical protein ACOYKZ_04575 [Chlamydiia bacterium]